jgi:regulator of nucleoside diphosphate kinase
MENLMSDHLPIVMTSRDFSLIESLISQWGEPFPGAAEIARSKLGRATIVFPADVPRDVVTLNSRVRFHIGHGPSQERVLVGGQSEEMYGVTLLLASPRGLALIGNAAGHVVQCLRKDGSFEELHIEEVVFQPERRLGLSLVHSGEPVAAPARMVTRVGALDGFGDDDPGPSAA